jgi:uncharacterized membrane protein
MQANLFSRFYLFSVLKIGFLIFSRNWSSWFFKLNAQVNLLVSGAAIYEGSYLDFRDGYIDD